MHYKRAGPPTDSHVRDLSVGQRKVDPMSYRLRGSSKAGACQWALTSTPWLMDVNEAAVYLQEGYKN
jgi:hypothetical protein